jgi:hypothetical protein
LLAFGAEKERFMGVWKTVDPGSGVIHNRLAGALTSFGSRMPVMGSSLMRFWAARNR